MTEEQNSESSAPLRPSGKVAPIGGQVVSGTMPIVEDASAQSVDAVKEPSVIVAQVAQVAEAKPTSWKWKQPEPSDPPPLDQRWVNEVDGYFRAKNVDNSCRFMGAAVRGRSHKQDGSYCDDSFRFASVGAWKIIVASDGAGSAKLSRFGSHIAVKAVRDNLKVTLEGIDLEKFPISEHLFSPKDEPSDIEQSLRSAMATAFTSAVEKIKDWVESENALPESDYRNYVDRVIREEASDFERINAATSGQSIKILLKDCNCTLLVAASTDVIMVKADETRVRVKLIVSCSVGDGMLVVFTREESQGSRAIQLMQPDVGQYAGETQFLTTNDMSFDKVSKRVRIDAPGAAENVIAVLAMTDGVADDYYEGVQGMERLYCDLVFNGIIPVVLPAQSVDSFRAECNKILIANSEVAAAELNKLQSQPQDGMSNAIKFTTNKNIKQLKETSQIRSLADLLVQETVLAEKRDGAEQSFRSIKYANRFLAALGKTEKQALGNPILLATVFASGPPLVPTSTISGGSLNTEYKVVAERLRNWLDGYIVRGSFDDRSLVMMYFTGDAP